MALPGLARDAIDDLVGLFTSQIELARAELKSDARAAVRGGLRILLFVPVFLIGYGLCLAALLYWAATHVGWLLTLSVAGIAHLMVAVLGIWAGKRRLEQVHFLDRSGAQLGESAVNVTRAITGTAHANVLPREK